MEAIRRYIKDRTSFEPEATNAMSQAFDETCRALRIAKGMDSAREVIAVRIVDLARSGMIDPNALRDRVLLEARTPQ
jgi:hypothetical protein